MKNINLKIEIKNNEVLTVLKGRKINELSINEKLNLIDVLVEMQELYNELYNLELKVA